MPNRTVTNLSELLVRAAELSPEWGTIRTVTALFGLSRTAQFKLIRQRRIRSIHVRPEGKQKGLRLIELASVRDYFRTFAE
jgi:hypothetical protein